MRIFIEAILPFLLPFLVFAAYRLLVTRGQGVLERTPWYLLTISGLVLACIAIASLAFLGGAPPGGRYLPSRIEHGRIVPGQVVPQ